MNNIATRWMSPDPLAEEYPNMSPYNFVKNNPVIYVDPDGRRVIPVNTEAFQAIINTLTEVDASHVKINKNGEIDKSSINSHKSKSNNFKSLKKLVNSKEVIKVNVTEGFDYKDENGNIQTEEFGEIIVDPETGEDFGFLGNTQTPGESSEKYNSVDDEVKININSNLDEEGQAETYSHEANGHGALYIKGKNHQHNKGKKGGCSSPQKSRTKL